MLSRIRSWFDLSRVSSWRPGSGRHHRQRRRRSGAPGGGGGGGGGGSFNRDRRLSFPELSAATAAANSNNNNSTTMSESSENQQNQQNQQQNHHPHHHHHHQQTPVEPVTVVAYHPKVQPEEVALPSNNNNPATVNTLSSTSYQNDRSSVQSHGSGGNHLDRHHRRRSTSFFRRYLLCCCCCCTGKSSETDSSSNSGAGGGGGINPNRAQSYRPREPSANSASDPAASNIAHRVYSSGTSESSLNPQSQQVALEAEASKPAPLAQLSPEQLLRSTATTTTTTEQKNCNEFANTSFQYPHYHHQVHHHNHPQPQPQPLPNLQLALKDKRPELLMLAPGSMMMAPKEAASSSSASASKQSFLEKLAKKGKVASANNGGHPHGASIFQTQLSKGSLEVSSKRIMKELSDLMRRQQTREDVSTAETITSSSTSTSTSTNTKMGVHLSTKSQFTVELVNDVLYEWYIKIYEFDRESQIYLDMQQYKVPFVKLHAVFPNSYPFDPPFIRVVAPYIERGYVMEGGAICLELLTKAGWTSAYTMEAVVVQLMASFVKGQARIRANKDVSKCFTRKSAENSFRHIVRIHDKHGWVDTPIYEG